MQQVVIANTEIAVSRISFGTGALHHLFANSQRKALLTAAASEGITHFDTSPYYGYGLAELDLGRFLSGQRAAFTVTTKVGLYPRGPAAGSASAVWRRKALGRLIPKVSLPLVNWQVDRARASLRQSLKRLRTDVVDFLMLHEPSRDLIRADEFLKWLEAERASGAVRYWGMAGAASNVAPWVQAGHPLAAVVQTKDSLTGREADFVSDCGRALQFTYGYLSSASVGPPPEEPEVVLRKALERNANGSVVVATRQRDRVATLARAAG
jgi:aryl-alcohol dehydrogenase-like predicted oxidoreductase